MRIYLDSNVIQLLKRDDSSNFYNAVLGDSLKNIYLYSEAHLFDLTRDQTEQKFADMNFLETITSNNCIYFEEYTRFELYKPKEYYNSHDWTPMTSIFDGDDEFSANMRKTLQATPFNLAEVLKEQQLPEDMPISMLSHFKESSNWYDYVQSSLKRNQILIEQQKEFKKMVQFLHGHLTLEMQLASFGINGFDGEKLIDRDAFLNSYINHITKGKQEKTAYNLFIEMYTNLEFLGIVKGKPRKQQMMNLINDARHAFFGGYCDIVVTNDEDMAKKTNFMYELHGIKTKLYTSSEFFKFIQSEPQKPNTLQNLFNELTIPEKLEIIKREVTTETPFAIKRLSQIYSEYFDILTFVDAPTGPYLYFSKEQSNFSRGTLVKELDYVTRWLTNSLGPDINGKGQLDRNEIIADEWKGRDWITDNFSLKLRCEGKITLFLILL